MLTTRLADVAPPEPDGGSSTTVILLVVGLVLVAGVVALAVLRARRGRGPGR